MILSDIPPHCQEIQFLGETMDTNDTKPDAHNIEQSPASETGQYSEIRPNHESPQSWSWIHKHIILLQCGLHALGPGFTSAILIPGTQEVVREFGITPQTATYLVAVHVLFLGYGPFLWSPLMDVYGRRPVLIGSMFLSTVAALGGGFAKAYGTLMAARIFQSIGISSGFVVPGVVVVDLFNVEERGSKNGIWAQMVAIGPSFGALIGGPIVSYVGWQWVLWVTAIFNGCQTLAYIFTCPETSYQHRHHSGNGKYHTSELFRLPKPIPGQLTLWTFIEPILLLQCPHIVLVAFAYGATFAITSPGLSTIVPLATHELYNFGPIAQGLFFIGPLVGVILGEFLAGPGSDWMMKQERRRAAASNERVRLESRLWIGISGYVLTLIGVIIFGVTLAHHTHWIGPCLGFAAANFGLQLITTPLKTYCVDCYVSHPSAALQLINVIRQTISFTVPFWSPNLNEATGYDLGFGIEAIILAVFYLASLAVLWKGAVWRESIQTEAEMED